MDFRPLYVTKYYNRDLNCLQAKQLLLVMSDDWQRVGEISKLSGYGMPRTKANLNYLVKAGSVEFKYAKVMGDKSRFNLTIFYRLKSA